MRNQLAGYIRQTALQQGAVLVGFTKIRKVEPVIVFAFPFSDTWFLRQPMKITRLLTTTYMTSKQVQAKVATILTSQGYTAHHKSVMSLYGDFRPLAVAAGLGEWGRHGIITHTDYGANLLFAATFTNAPLTAANTSRIFPHHCTSCNQCINACPAKAFTKNGFSTTRCLTYTMKGCSECVTACTKKPDKETVPLSGFSRENIVQT